MADGISIAASIIALIGTCSTISRRSLELITSLQGVPDELLSLSNEVNDIGVILNVIYERHSIARGERSVPDARAQHPLDLESAALALQLRTAKALTLEFDDFLQSFKKVELRKGRIVLERVNWVRKRAQASRLRSRLATVKENLQLLLSANAR
jgi:hypothetical protein